MNVYNVWICVESIDEENDNNGTDIDARKVAKFKDADSALAYAFELERDNDTPRDEGGFTI